MTDYELPRHIWGLIKEHVSESELLEVKNMLGESLVDQTIELRQEVLLLLEIWNDVKQRQLVSNKLPEPPSIRDLLVKDIKIFADNIREKIVEDKSYSGNVYGVLGNDRVLDYVFKETFSSGSSRQSSARSTGSNSSRACLSIDELSGLGLIGSKCHGTQQKKEEVVERTRELLRSEVDQLEEDVCYIQDCLENDSRMGVAPSITELKRTRAHLEKVDRRLPSTSDLTSVRPFDRRSLRQFLIQCDDLFTNETIAAECDEGFRSRPPSSSSSSSSSSSTASPAPGSFPSRSLQLPASLSQLTSGSGHDTVTYGEADFVSVGAPLAFSTQLGDERRSDSAEVQGIAGGDDVDDDGGGDEDDDDVVGDNLPTSSDSSHASSSSSSGVFSQTQVASSSSSSTSSASSSSSSGRVSSLQKRMDLLLSYRK